MSESAILEGGCLCGAVRYRITGHFRHAGHCHCNLCRRASGAPVVTWLTVAKADFDRLQGRLVFYKATPKAVRGFCANCGSPITFDALDLPNEIDVTAGTLDNPKAIRPERHIWTASRIGWLAMNDGLPESETD